MFWVCLRLGLMRQFNFVSSVYLRAIHMRGDSHASPRVGYGVWTRCRYSLAPREIQVPITLLPIARIPLWCPSPCAHSAASSPFPSHLRCRTRIIIARAEQTSPTIPARHHQEKPSLDTAAALPPHCTHTVILAVRARADLAPPRRLPRRGHPRRRPRPTCPRCHPRHVRPCGLGSPFPGAGAATRLQPQRSIGQPLTPGTTTAGKG